MSATDGPLRHIWTNDLERAAALRMDATKELLGPFVVVDVRREPLRAMTDDMAYGWDEVRREGFPGMTPAGFVKMFCGSHVGCTPDTIITRIDSGTSPFS